MTFECALGPGRKTPPAQGCSLFDGKIQKYSEQCGRKTFVRLFAFRVVVLLSCSFALEVAAIIIKHFTFQKEKDTKKIN